MTEDDVEEMYGEALNSEEVDWVCTMIFVKTAIERGLGDDAEREAMQHDYAIARAGLLAFLGIGSC